MGNRQPSSYHICESAPYEDEVNDADYEPYEEEEEDDTTTMLVGPAAAGEEHFARKYGWQTNVVSNQDQDDERNIYYEAPGHNFVARVHEVRLPAESSLPNSENTVDRIEAAQLRNPLEPWELEGVHESTGRSYEELRRMFPEARSMETPASNTRPVTEGAIICAQCRRTATPEYVDWLREGNVAFCSLCGMTRSPLDPTEDPDYYGFNPRTVIYHCTCRCHCPEVYSSDMDIDSDFEDAAEGEGDDDFSNPLLAGLRTPVSNHLTRTLPVFAEPHDLDANPFVPTSSAEASRDEMRHEFGLPELRFSDHADEFEADIHTITMAMDDAEVSRALEDYETALSYLDFALYTCDNLELDPGQAPFSDALSAHREVFQILYEQELEAEGIPLDYEDAQAAYAAYLAY
ncbi:hypothetical protein LTR64_007310 [Lithohypha guttulata]|uniref:uncharacterized protein n=1 Tax=Lithohypha guttulata TaxID=1690604 RepID=UPI002DE0BB46|nr:hypothetical protein LTR51_004134 [Lithohypha guttulata]